MNKKRPNEIKSWFVQEADSLIAFFQTASSGFKGKDHEDKHLTMLSELVFLNAYVAFETFLSDLFLAYINKKSINFQREQEAKIKKLVKSEFGDWYAARVVMEKSLHLSATEVEKLIDPKGYKLTFGNSDEIKRLAGGWVAQEYRSNIFRLSSDDFLFIDCCREMRNAIAHRSKRSFDSMNGMLRSIPAPSTIEFLRRPANDVKSVGVFLKSKPGGQLRVISCITRLKDIAGRM